MKEMTEEEQIVLKHFIEECKSFCNYIVDNKLLKDTQDRVEHLLINLKKDLDSDKLLAKFYKDNNKGIRIGDRVLVNSPDKAFPIINKEGTVYYNEGYSYSIDFDEYGKMCWFEPHEMELL